MFSKLCYNHNTVVWGYGSVGRAVRSQRTGHEFESRYLHHHKAPLWRCFFVAEITSRSESCIPPCSREHLPYSLYEKVEGRKANTKLSRRSRRKSRLDCQFPFSSHHHKAPLWRCFFRGGENEPLGIVHSLPRPARGNFFQPAYIDCLHVVLLRRFVKYCSRQILIRS